LIIPIGTESCYQDCDDEDSLLRTNVLMRLMLCVADGTVACFSTNTVRAAVLSG